MSYNHTIVGIWTTTIPPGRKDLMIPGGLELCISNAVLVDPLSHTNGRTVLKLIYATHTIPLTDSARSESAVLCALTPGSKEHRRLDLTLPENWNVTFEVTGGNTICLTGNWKSVHAAPALDCGDSFSNLSQSQQSIQSIYSKKRPRDLSTPRSVTKKLPGPTQGPPADTHAAPHMPVGDINAPIAAVSRLPDTKQPAALHSDSTAEAPKSGSATAGTATSSSVHGTTSPAPGMAPPAPGAVRVLREQHGEGSCIVQEGDTISLLYLLTAGEAVLSQSQAESRTVKIGTEMIFPGVDEGMKGMKAGGERVIYIPPSIAQGYSGVPHNSPVVLQCKVIDIKKPESVSGL